MKQIVINLLSNAVKFTQKGGITVKLKKRKNMLQVTVKDTGVGIKEEDSKKMFTEFCTISANQELNPNGTGLGLYLSKQFAQLMKATIAMKSKYGEGTKFTVRIPLAEEGMSEEEELEEGVNPSAIPEGVSKFVYHKLSTKETLQKSTADLAAMPAEESKGLCTVLIVDDNPINSLVIGEILSRYSLNVEKALNGKEAIELIEARKTPYSLIFMDVNMPIMGGIEVSNSINIGCKHTKEKNGWR